jgi:hypothetical protein
VIVAASELATVIVRRVTEMQEREQSRMHNGEDTFAAYRELVGANRALAAVLDLMTELTKNRGELT